MRIILDKEAYAKFDELAKARNMTTRELGSQLLADFLTKEK